MQILVTGATGYVGRHVAAQLVAAGHDVRGVVREAGRRASLPPGVRPVTGTLAEFATLRAAALAADAIVHTAFPQHPGGPLAALAVEARFLRELVDALDGSDKPVVVSNGSIFLGDSRAGRLDERAPVLAEHPGAVRAEATRVVTTARGLRGVELRLASFVYGHAGSQFLPALLAHARASGRSLYIDDGSARACAVHVEAAAAAYVLALRCNDARGVYHIASDEEPSLASVAAAVALAVGPGCEPTSVTREAAAEALGPMVAMFLAADHRLDASRARRELGWGHAGHVPLLWDVARGSYAR